MILISVRSEFVEDKRQFKSDSRAMTFLKRINNLHISHRIKLAGKRPQLKHFKKRVKFRMVQDRLAYKEAVKVWELTLRSSVPVKIEIINTKHNQLTLPI